MRREMSALILTLLLLFTLTGTACNKGGDTYELRGILNDWKTDASPPVAVVDGQEIPLAEGMVAFAEKAKKGQEYIFTIDKHGSIIHAKPAQN